ncbi:hypothetical protein COCCADRAFT_39421 [Bipolaris zeicola 26-R-13]|uniref:Uncharacterized protein n=1 Tax=Cochliobolus carbonum (strain 26-R-13) TaxID=930089 RepID=W6Y5C7_COCC2|nr:uncharacterized protein COCCADRAFT_39421 [Bipolaris zeicola 26-R-13]EUC30314.1 hypothetical protein COCCADRAFT_39421 [Bipolaris zeicola 26-R-13]
MLCGLFWSCGGWRCWNLRDQDERHDGITEVWCVCVCHESGWPWSQMCVFIFGQKDCAACLAYGLRDYKLARLASKDRRRLRSEDDNDEFVSHQRELRCMI